MIGRLYGAVVAIESDRVVIDVSGVGYEVAMTARAISNLPMGESAEVFTHLHVREDVMLLFGFPTRADRDLFRILLGVSGVGPKVALAVLGVLSADALRTAVRSDDIDVLTQVPGIGKRGAQKILLDLKPRLVDIEADVLDGGGQGGTVRQALEALGYTTGEIRHVLSSVDHTAPIEDQVRMALQEIARTHS